MEAGTRTREELARRGHGTAGRLAAPGRRRLPRADQAEGPVAAAVHHGHDDVRGRRPSVGRVLLTCLGGALSAGGAGAINHPGPRHRRLDDPHGAAPGSVGRVSPRRACASASARDRVVRPAGAHRDVLAAALALSGLLGYVLVYTLLAQASHAAEHRHRRRRRRGAAARGLGGHQRHARRQGAYLFAIVFYWTPPHFWALSLLMRDEYAEAGVPMLPVVRGVGRRAGRSCSTRSCSWR